MSEGLSRQHWIEACDFVSAPWQRSKAGNIYCRDFGCTYTVKDLGHMLYSGVVVGAGGVRKDIPAGSFNDVLNEMWPHGEESPIDPSQGG